MIRVSSHDDTVDHAPVVMYRHASLQNDVALQRRTLARAM
jgi:hypothetical protein